MLSDHVTQSPADEKKKKIFSERWWQRQLSIRDTSIEFISYKLWSSILLSMSACVWERASAAGVDTCDRCSCFCVYEKNLLRNERYCSHCANTLRVRGKERERNATYLLLQYYWSIKVDAFGGKQGQCHPIWSNIVITGKCLLLLIFRPISPGTVVDTWVSECVFGCVRLKADACTILNGPQK